MSGAQAIWTPESRLAQSLRMAEIHASNLNLVGFRGRSHTDATKFKVAAENAKTSPDEIVAAAHALWPTNAKAREVAYTDWRQYGLVPGEYGHLLEAQGGVCKVCGRPPAARRLAVDHHHECGRYKKWLRASVRGLLCTNCNRGLLRERPELLIKAAVYFQAHLDVCPMRKEVASVQRA